MATLCSEEEKSEIPSLLFFALHVISAAGNQDAAIMEKLFEYSLRPFGCLLTEEFMRENSAWGVRAVDALTHLANKRSEAWSLFARDGLLLHIFFLSVFLDLEQGVCILPCFRDPFLVSFLVPKPWVYR